MRVTFLGTGTSHGIPVPACHCPVCTSADPRDTRWRSSVLFTKQGKNLVVDTGPEFRLQMLRARVESIAAVLYTHSHADHLNGFDDLRSYAKDASLDIYCDAETDAFLRSHESYALSRGGRHDGLPHLVDHVLPPCAEADISGFSVTGIPVTHGRHVIYAYRIDSVVYAPDCNAIGEESLQAMEGCDTLIIGALRYRSHPTHFSVDEAIAVARRIHPRQTWFTHICHEIRHSDLAGKLPPSIQPAWDMLSVEV